MTENSILSPLNYKPELKKTLSSNPSVTLLMTRIPATLNEEGMKNLLSAFSSVLNIRLVVNKGGFAGVKGLNYAYITVASKVTAVSIIDHFHMKPPFNLSVTYKPAVNEREKDREQELLDKILGNIGEKEYVNNQRMKEKDNTELKTSLNEETLSLNSESNIFMFNRPLVISSEEANSQKPCLCGKLGVMICSRCRIIWYCSRICQINHWSIHKSECVDYFDDGQPRNDTVKVENGKELSLPISQKNDAGDANIRGLHSDTRRKISEDLSEKVAHQELPYKSNSNSEIKSNASVLKQFMDEDKYDIESVHQPNKIDSEHNLPNNTPCLPLDSDDSLPPQWSIEKSSELVNLQACNQNLRKGACSPNACLQEGSPFTCLEEDVALSSTFDPRASSSQMVEDNQNTAELCNNQSGLDNTVEPIQNVEANISDKTIASSNVILTPETGTVLSICNGDSKFYNFSTSENILIGDIGMKSQTGNMARIALELPRDWSLMITNFDEISADGIPIKVKNFENDILVRLAGVEFTEPWSNDLMEIMQIVLGRRNEGPSPLWVRHVAWDGLVQLVDIKDEDENDIAGILVRINVMKVVVPKPPIMMQDIDFGEIDNGSFVKLKDIGESSQLGLVKCIDEKERHWLEEVMDLSDHGTPISEPIVGQVVALYLQTRDGKKTARAEILKVDKEKQQVFCQCIDYHDRRVEAIDSLFQPPPACRSISPLCPKVVLFGVPDIPRKEAKSKLNYIDSDLLSQPMKLFIRGKSTQGQIVELFDSEGNSINKILSTVLGSKNNIEKDVAPIEFKKSNSFNSFSVVMSPDYKLPSSFVSMPFEKPNPVVILHVTSPTQIYVCPVSHWTELTKFQEYLQTLVSRGKEDILCASNLVIGQLVLSRSGQDNNIYRGTVLKIHKNKVSIYCPDYGFMEKIPLTNVYPLEDGHVAQAKYWARPCALVDWVGEVPEATSTEKDEIISLLPVTSHVNLNVIREDGVILIVDIVGIKR